MYFPSKFLFIIFFPPFLFLSSGCGSDSPEPPKPNIVIILADDMGYGDVQALNPRGRIPTPAIDALAGEGISFSNAHASASVCTPSRYGLLTGRYAFRSERAARGIGGFEEPVIEPGRKTLASVLGEAGYTSACIGKWHLGVDWQTIDGEERAVMNSTTRYSNVDYTKPVTGGPNDFGFDYSFIHPASLDIPPYLFLRNQEATDPEMVLTTDVYPSRKEDTEYAWDKKHTVEQDVYWEKGVWWRRGEMARSFRIEDCHTTIMKEGIAFIERQVREAPGEPFFLYLPLTGPHTPWVPREQFKGESPIGAYGDFVMDIDHIVGSVKQTLVDQGVSENTLLIFTSDNGAYWPQEEIALHNHDSNEGTRGQKGDIWDGGHHVPFIVSWPAQIREPSVYEHLVSFTDFFATFSELTGQKIPEGQGEDSFSFFHVLSGNLEKPVRQDMVHHSSRGMYSIRSKGWKLIDGLGSGGFTAPASYEAEPGGPEGQLYNLEEDPEESVNLYLEMPGKVQTLKKELEKKY